MTSVASDGTELVEDEQYTDNEENDEDDYSREEEDGLDRTSSEISEEMTTESSPLKLSVKEKKKLASYAHSLGDKLKCKIVGKSGVTESVVFSFLETLEKDELLKVKIHRTCPGELKDTILHLVENWAL